MIKEGIGKIIKELREIRSFGIVRDSESIKQFPRHKADCSMTGELRLYREIRGILIPPGGALLPEMIRRSSWIKTQCTECGGFTLMELIIWEQNKKG